MVRSGGGILGSLLGGFIASVLGRRVSYFLISLFALFASTYIFTRLDPLDPAFPVLGVRPRVRQYRLLRLAPALPAGAVPHRVRATGSGVSFNTGRVVSGSSSSAGFLIDLLGGEYPRVGFATGLIYGVGMLLIWLARAVGRWRMDGGGHRADWRRPGRHGRWRSGSRPADSPSSPSTAAPNA